MIGKGLRATVVVGIVGGPLYVGLTLAATPSLAQDPVPLPPLPSLSPSPAPSPSRGPTPDEPLPSAVPAPSEKPPSSPAPRGSGSSGGGTNGTNRVTGNVLSSGRLRVSRVSLGDLEGCRLAPRGTGPIRARRPWVPPGLVPPSPPGMAGPQSTRRLVGQLDRATRGPRALRRALLAVAGPFPVAGLARWSDDWHAYRACPYPHLHEGIDIFAPHGAPVVASANGRVSKVVSDDVSGLAVEIRDARGTEYYYAHLASFAPGMRAGRAVRVGRVLGYVGTTGNARGTPPHLHFEIQPGGLPVPPKSFVDRWLLLAEQRARVVAATSRLAALHGRRALAVRLVQRIRLRERAEAIPPPPMLLPLGLPGPVPSDVPSLCTSIPAILLLALATRRSVRRSSVLGRSGPVFATGGPPSAGRARAARPALHADRRELAGSARRR